MRASGSCAGKSTRRQICSFIGRQINREPGLRTERKQRKRFSRSDIPLSTNLRAMQKKGPLSQPSPPEEERRRAGSLRGLGGKARITLRTFSPRTFGDAGKGLLSPTLSPGEAREKSGSLRGLGGQSANTLGTFSPRPSPHRMERGIKTRASARRARFTAGILSSSNALWLDHRPAAAAASTVRLSQPSH